MIQITVSRPIVLFPPFKRNNKKPKNFPPDVFRLFLFCSCPRTKPFSSPMVHKRQFPQKQAIKNTPQLRARYFVVHHRGLEPRTHWLRVSCSTNWANGAYKQAPGWAKTRPGGLFFKREVGIYLFSQAVSSQLSSARVSLTSVFGMGTGGTSPSSTPTVSFFWGCTLKTEYWTALANRVSYKDGVKPSTY